MPPERSGRKVPRAQAGTAGDGTRVAGAVDGGTGALTAGRKTRGTPAGNAGRGGDEEKVVKPGQDKLHRRKLPRAARVNQKCQYRSGERAPIVSPTRPRLSGEDLSQDHCRRRIPRAGGCPARGLPVLRARRA